VITSVTIDTQDEARAVLRAWCAATNQPWPAALDDLPPNALIARARFVVLVADYLLTGTALLRAAAASLRTVANPQQPADLPRATRQDGAVMAPPDRL
jgi:hypothetical protein